MDQNSALPFCKVSAFLCRLEIFRDFNLLHVDFKCCSCPSASCVSAANGISWNIGAAEVLFWLTICNLFVIITSSPSLFWSYCTFFVAFYYFSCVYICGLLFHVFSLTFFFCARNWPSGCCVSALIINNWIIIIININIVIDGKGGSNNISHIYSSFSIPITTSLITSIIITGILALRMSCWWVQRTVSSVT
jgi:hypothetical protein